jgi:hypothetical protein
VLGEKVEASLTLGHEKAACMGVGPRAVLEKVEPCFWAVAASVKSTRTRGILRGVGFFDISWTWLAIRASVTTREDDRTITDMVS